MDDHLSKKSSEVKVSFLSATYHAIVEILRSKIDNHSEKIIVLEDFEVFRILFENPTIHDDANADQVEVLGAESINSFFQDSVEAPVFACLARLDFSLSPTEAFASKSELRSNWAAMEDHKNIVPLWQELDECEKVKVTTSVEKEKIEPCCTDANKATETQGEKSPLINGSEAGSDKVRQNDSVGKEKGSENKSKLPKVHCHSIGASADYTNDHGDYSSRTQSSPSSDYNLGSYGSMRKEKEWRRTLACKLFEERNNAEESEGMDLLWETYEMEATKSKASGKNSKHNSIKKKKDTNKYEIKYHEEGKIERDGQEVDEDEESDGQLCCLQALKFSTGKMNLGMGMGRPNLVKISKAIKGIGWLHNLKRHSKKVHNGDKY